MAASLYNQSKTRLFPQLALASRALAQ